MPTTSSPNKHLKQIIFFSPNKNRTFIRAHKINQVVPFRDHILIDRFVQGTIYLLAATHVHSTRRELEIDRINRAIMDEHPPAAPARQSARGGTPFFFPRPHARCGSRKTPQLCGGSWTGGGEGEPSSRGGRRLGHHHHHHPDTARARREAPAPHVDRAPPPLACLLY
jgi:hypothetical protein